MHAVFSKCEQYCYYLADKPRNNKSLTFVMLNPAVTPIKQIHANSTVRICRRYAAREHRDLIIVNLYAYRATKPKHLVLARTDIIGPYNDYFLRIALSTPNTKIVCAYGNNATESRENWFLREAARHHVTLYALGLTKTMRRPIHPQGVPYGQDNELIIYPN